MSRQHEVWDKAHVDSLITKVWGDTNHERGRHWDIQMRVAKHINENKDVLEVAPGVGHLFKIIRDKCATYRGRDTSPAMIAQFQDYFPNADIALGDAYDLQDQESADIVVSVDMLMHLPGDLTVPIVQMWEKAKEKLIFTIRLAEEKSWIVKRNYNHEDGTRSLIVRGDTKEDLGKIFAQLEGLDRVEEDYYDSRTSIIVCYREA